MYVFKYKKNNLIIYSLIELDKKIDSLKYTSIKVIEWKKTPKHLNLGKIIGRYLLNYSRATGNDICRLCHKDEETGLHILWKCKSFFINEIITWN